MKKQFLNSIAMFLSPVIPMLLACFFIVFIDTITGRQAARKRGDEVNSRTTRLGLTSKLMIYFSIILMAYFTDYYILNEITRNYVWFDYMFSRIWVSILIYIEWTSINENIKVIKGFSINEKAVELVKGLKALVRELSSIKQNK